MYNYPTDILRKRIDKGTTIKTVVDAETGEFIEYSSERKGRIKTLVGYLTLVVISLSVFYFVVAGPIFDTQKSIDAVKAITDSSMSMQDKRILEELKTKGTVVYEEEGDGVVSILISLNTVELEPALKLAMKLTNLKEVSTDRRTISVVLVSK